MTSKRKIIWVMAFILIMAVAIVLCVELFATTSETRYDGTLVRCGREWLSPDETSFSYMTDNG